MSKLDMSLDDITKKTSKDNPRKRRGGGRGGRGRGGGRRRGSGGYGAQRRGGYGGNRNAPYQRRQGGGASSKISISNLDYEVTGEDIREIFEQVGFVKKAEINYGPGGRSRGTGFVIFGNARDAQTAVSEYNNAEVDGRPMYIKFEQRGGRAGFVQQQRFGGNNGGGYRPRGRRRGGRGRGRGRGGRGGRGGRRQRSENKPTPTAEQLDKDMDAYFGGKDESSAGQPAAPVNDGQPPALSAPSNGKDKETEEETKAE